MDSSHASLSITIAVYSGHASLALGPDSVCHALGLYLLLLLYLCATVAMAAVIISWKVTHYYIHSKCLPSCCLLQSVQTSSVTSACMWLYFLHISIFCLLAFCCLLHSVSSSVSHAPIFFSPCEARTCVARYCYHMSSVCLFVTLMDCDHIHWDSQKVISWINSVILPILVDANIVRKFKVAAGRNFVKFMGKLEWGWVKTTFFCQ